MHFSIVFCCIITCAWTVDGYLFAQISQKLASTAVQAVAKKIKSDKSAKTELGSLLKVNQVLGYGSPSNGVVAVRFEATFKKAGGVTGDRGEMRGQVKASVEEEGGKIGRVKQCSVFRDLGWGRTWDMKC